MGEDSYRFRVGCERVLELSIRTGAVGFGESVKAKARSFETSGDVDRAGIASNVEISLGKEGDQFGDFGFANQTDRS